MAYNTKKYLDEEGLKQVIRLLDEYPDNQILGTVIDEIQSELDKKADIVDIPEVPVQDVQVNGTSAVSNGAANIPVASDNALGVVKTGGAGGATIQINSVGVLNTIPASSADIKNGTNFLTIVPARQHTSVFYGLAKAAGDTTQSTSDNAVGTYTYEAQLAIRNMLGVPSYPTASSIKLGNSNTIIVPTSMQHEAAFYGLSKAAGVDMKDSSNLVGTYTPEAKGAIQKMLGVSDLIATEENNLIASKAYAVGDVFTANGKLYKATAAIATDGAIITDGANANCEETNIGEGFPHDIQINGTSIVNNGVANIPIGTQNTLGAVMPNQYGGIIVNNSGQINIYRATDAEIKAGTNIYKPIVAGNASTAAFYGLAKAAGDTTQSASSNAVGIYTDNAKASIKSMLGIVDGSTGTVNITGATPTINAVENTRYVCGEVTSLSFTPPSSGISIVRFTSGSSVTVLTIPNTVKFPEWFDPTALEINTIYEICVTDGTFGAVMSWAL